ncbi:MAG: hypothetical protein E6980_16440 [Clostridium sp.]|nr:hypothetical protein [Clostridium sp.]
MINDCSFFYLHCLIKKFLLLIIYILNSWCNNGSVTNSKRAIYCQVDWIISYLGYDHSNFNERKYPNIIKVIADLEKCENLSGEFPLKLRLIQVLEIAPTFLISQIREIYKMYPIG